MIRRLSFAVAGVFFALAAHAATLTQIAADKSQLGFVFKQMGVAVDGRFRKFDAQINVDPAQPASGKVRIDVDIASIDTGSPEGDGEVKGKLWLNTAAFPKATFVASTIKSLGGGRYEARGPLTVKGISRDIVAPFTIRNEAAGSWAEGGFALPRLQYKIGEGEWADTDTVADAVQVKFKLFLTATTPKTKEKK